MTERLYYHDSFLYNFDARVLESAERNGRTAVVLDRTAFYPTSGGQVFDTGKFVLSDKRELPVTEVGEEEDGQIFHVVPENLEKGQSVVGLIDAARRRDHMQQHSGQHVLSAAFVRLLNAPTVSFHMGVETCTIDLAVRSLSTVQLEKAEQLANEIVTEDRPVNIRFVSLEEARQLDLRKLPPKQRGDLRLIDIVDFVCGARAVSTARQDYTTLTQAAAPLSAHIRELPQQIDKLLQENKAAGKNHHKLLEELADFHAERLLAQEEGTPHLVISVFPERDAAFIKLLAQKLTASPGQVIALLASGAGQTTLVFAQSPGMKSNMGKLMKEAMNKLGGRGGGSAEMAQGGLPGAIDSAKMEQTLREAAAKL